MENDQRLTVLFSQVQKTQGPTRVTLQISLLFHTNTGYCLVSESLHRLVTLTHTPLFHQTTFCLPAKCQPNPPGSRKVFRRTPFPTETPALLSMVYSIAAAATKELMKTQGISESIPGLLNQNLHLIRSQVICTHIQVWEALLLHPSTHIHKFPYGHTPLRIWFFLLVTALLRSNSHIIKFTHLKCLTQCFWVYSQNCATITTM